MPTADSNAAWNQSPPEGPPPVTFALVDGEVWMQTESGQKVVVRQYGDKLRWFLCPSWKDRQGMSITHAQAPAYISRPYARLALAAAQAARQIVAEVRERAERKVEPLRRENRRLRDERAEFQEQATERARQIYATARHQALREWRAGDRQAEAPETLKGVRHVKRLEAHPAIVYFLMRGGEVVYVGQSTAPWPSRILQHKDEGTKDFDDVWYLEVDAHSVCRVEEEYIRKFKPEYNRSGKR
jgi:hypothetical protein